MSPICKPIETWPAGRISIPKIPKKISIPWKMFGRALAKVRIRSQS